MNKKKIICFIVLCCISCIIWIYFSYIDYIRFIEYIKAYWILFFILITVIFLKKNILSYIIVFSMHLGLIVEYIIHITQEHRAMTGAFYNFGILTAGCILGAFIQFIFDIKKKKNKH